MSQDFEDRGRCIGPGGSTFAVWGTTGGSVATEDELWLQTATAG